MAKGNAVWGIDIGQCALKALRCSYDGRDGQVVVDACEFIEYPKMLSQADADEEASIREAIKEFLSRHTVRGDKVAIAVSGQKAVGLARFIKLPPVEAKKIPDIVKYEAKQQIPFALEDVIWDYQTLVGGGDMDGMALETEVGLFAMKRDQVFRSIRPLDDARVPIDIIQLPPVAVLNTAVQHLILEQKRKGETAPTSFDPENPPPSVMVLAMGTSTTDLVVTNGHRVWQRTIHIGGNAFTKQLTKDLKLTFAKAEYLKRNAAEAEDPKKVFQAMRPVFNDFVAEVQRSLGFYQSLDKSAKISHIVGMGNGFKLPGLQPYLEKNIGYKVQLMDSLPGASGTALDDPKYKENVPSLGVCYGLALQALNRSKLRTNLVPRELLRARMIRRKKPWVLAASSLLMAGLGMSFLFYHARAKEVAADRFKTQFGEVTRVESKSNGFRGEDEKNVSTFAALKTVGDQVVGNADRRFQMLELMKVINEALPREPGLTREEVSKLPLEERPVIYIEKIEMEYFGGEKKLADWFTEERQEAYRGTLRSLKALTTGQDTPPPAAATEGTADGASPPTDGTAAAGAPADGTATEGGEEIGTPDGEGWVIELDGFHYHNLPRMVPNAGAEFVRRTLIKNLMEGKVSLPSINGQPDEFTMKEMGISFPLLAFDGQIKNTEVPNPKYVPVLPTDVDPVQLNAAPQGIPGITTRVTNPDEIPKPKEEPTIKVRTNKFKVQFIWQPKRLKERLELRQNPPTDSTSTDNQVAGG